MIRSTSGKHAIKGKRKVTNIRTKSFCCALLLALGIYGVKRILTDEVAEEGYNLIAASESIPINDEIKNSADIVEQKIINYVGAYKETVKIPEIEMPAEPEIVELSREEKLNVVLERHDMSEFEYYQTVSTVAHEAGPNNYDECYEVICVAYNRTLSKTWCAFCKYVSGADGTRLIDQIRLSGQFAGFLPYEAGYDKDKYIGTAADNATMDFLYSLDRSNNYLSFNAPWYEGCPKDAYQLHPECKGNKYFGLLTEDDLNEKAINADVKLTRTKN